MSEGEEAMTPLEAETIVMLNQVEQIAREVKEACEDENVEEELFKSLMDAVQCGWKDGEMDLGDVAFNKMCMIGVLVQHLKGMCTSREMERDFYREIMSVVNKNWSK